MHNRKSKSQLLKSLESQLLKSLEAREETLSKRLFEIKEEVDLFEEDYCQDLEDEQKSIEKSLRKCRNTIKKLEEGSDVN